MNASDRTAIFETLPVHQAVYKQIIPAIVSQMIALIYNLADTYFVGMLNDPHQTAAITIAAPSFVMLTAISNLFGVGGASAIAREGLYAHVCFRLPFSLWPDPFSFFVERRKKHLPLQWDTQNMWLFWVAHLLY